MICFVKMVEMIPLKRLKAATHFRQLKDERLEMCNPDDEGAKEVSLYQIDLEFLNKPKIEEVILFSKRKFLG